MNLDAVSYFTNGLCVSTGTLDAVAYFTNGLIYPADGPGVRLPDRDDVIAAIAAKRWFDVGRNHHVGDDTFE